ncbi:hypothetical protein E2C01_008674 [Portunus trituberculatus]|uniref:Uncharacterized protein n=1 Tax=Portunus trituberculatus TaxID=210409 RepID=A0A5B7D2G1_PORTR|nr:hypothetical protein [Portunus trituberculatus]
MLWTTAISQVRAGPPRDSEHGVVSVRQALLEGVNKQAKSQCCGCIVGPLPSIVPNPSAAPAASGRRAALGRPAPAGGGAGSVM